MTERERLMAVVEAARGIAGQLLLAEMTIEDRCDADVEGAYDAMIERMRPLIFALDDHPPEEAGETVEMAVWQSHNGENDGLIVFAPTHLALDEATRLGTTRLTVTKGGGA